jgi:flagellar biosynthesis protein FliQ
METVALTLYAAALKDAALLALPIVGAVAAVGVVVGILQTIVQVQDQNVAFAPKLAAVALIIAAGGPAALDVLRQLLLLALHTLPRLAQPS